MRFGVLWVGTLFLVGCGGLGAHNDLVDETPALGGLDTDLDPDEAPDEQDDPTDPNDPGEDTDDELPCVAPELGISPQGPQAGPPLTPTHIGVGLDGILESDAIRDFYLDGEPVSAWLNVILIEYTNEQVVADCRVIFDASTSASFSVPWATDTGETLFQAWSFDLNPATAYTDCPPLASGYPTDARDYVKSLQSQFGLGMGAGPLSAESRSMLQDSVESEGQSWGLDWAPFVLGVYTWFGGQEANETGYAILYDPYCYQLDETTPKILTPSFGPLSGYLSGLGMLWYFPVPQ